MNKFLIFLVRRRNLRGIPRTMQIFLLTILFVGTLASSLIHASESCVTPVQESGERALPEGSAAQGSSSNPGERSTNEDFSGRHGAGARNSDGVYSGPPGPDRGFMESSSDNGRGASEP